MYDGILPRARVCTRGQAGRERGAEKEEERARVMGQR